MGHLDWVAGMSEPARLRATIDGRVVDLEVSSEGIVAQRGDDATLEVRLLGEAGADARHVAVRSAGTSFHATAAQIGDDIWVFVNGDVFVIEVEAARQTPTRRRAPITGALTAPMPATVIGVLVEPGDAVSGGDTLLLLEAMKMELPVRAPADGRVKAVHCKAGELVQPGVTLVELDEADDAGA